MSNEAFELFMAQQEAMSEMVDGPLEINPNPLTGTTNRKYPFETIKEVLDCVDSDKSDDYLMVLIHDLGLDCDDLKVIADARQDGTLHTLCDVDRDEDFVGMYITEPNVVKRPSHNITNIGPEVVIGFDRAMMPDVSVVSEGIRCGEINAVYGEKSVGKSMIDTTAPLGKAVYVLHDPSEAKEYLIEYDKPVSCDVMTDGSISVGYEVKTIEYTWNEYPEITPPPVPVMASETYIAETNRGVIPVHWHQYLNGVHKFQTFGGDDEGMVGYGTKPFKVYRWTNMPEGYGCGGIDD